MPEFSITTGSDTFAYQPGPNANYAQARFPQIRSGSHMVYLSMPINLPAGTVVMSAKLQIPVHDRWVAQTATLKAVADPWSVSSLTWNNKPAVLTVGSGISAAVTTGAVADGSWVEIDVTAMVQQIVNGRPNYGFRLESSQSGSPSALIRGFESGYESWTLDLVTSEAPFVATAVAPQGVISLSKWVAQVDEVDALAAIRVQVDAAADSVSPDFDSGAVATTEPVLDLAATAYAGLADGASTYWRAQVTTLDGESSGWSDWVQVTRHVKATMTLSSPSGTDLWDASPSIDASLTPAGSSTTRWQVIVLDGNDPTDVRYDSGSKLTGATLDHNIWADWKNPPFPKDGPYRIIVRAWDRSDRVSSIGDPTYIETVRDVTLSVKAGQTPPTTLTATPAAGDGYPEVVLSWTRAADPDRFDVLRDGVRIAEVDVDDARVSPGVWEWSDDGAPAWQEATYTVRAVTNSEQSADSPAAVVTVEVTGVWLRSTFGDVMLAADDIDNFAQTDKRTTIELPYRAEDVDIITAVSGVSGTYKGFLSSYDGDVDAARVILEQIRRHPDQSVRLVAATLNADVYLRGLSVTPSSDIIPDRNRRHTVSFGFFETD